MPPGSRMAGPHVLLMNETIRLATSAFCILLACSCTATRTHGRDETARRTESQVRESLSIKDLIASLPPYSYHEGSIEGAQKWLRNVTIERTELNGITCDSVLFPADGCRGATRFYLDRVAGKYWERYYEWEPGSSDTLTEYDVVNNKLVFVSSKVVSPPIPL